MQMNSMDPYEPLVVVKMREIFKKEYNTKNKNCLSQYNYFVVTFVDVQKLYYWF